MQTDNNKATRSAGVRMWPVIALAVGLALYAQAHAQRTATAVARWLRLSFADGGGVGVCVSGGDDDPVWLWG
jgi:hypothetical protein